MEIGTIIRDDYVETDSPYHYGLIIEEFGTQVTILYIAEDTIKLKNYPKGMLESPKVKMTTIGTSNSVADVVEHLKNEFEKIRKADNV